MPAVIALGLIFLVKGDAHGTCRSESTAACAASSGVVDCLCGVVCAICTIEDPVVVGAAGRGSSCSIVGVFVHVRQGDVGVVF